MNFPTSKSAWVQNLIVALVGAWLFLNAAWAYSQMPLYFWSEYRDGAVAEGFSGALKLSLALAPVPDLVPWAALVFPWALFRSLPREGCGWPSVLLAIPGFCLAAIFQWLAAEAFLKSVAMNPPAPDTLRWVANMGLMVGLVGFAIWQEWRLWVTASKR
jgi:hypothetical protein